jgi:hypothetical protein
MISAGVASFLTVPKTDEYLRKTGVKLELAMMNGWLLASISDIQENVFQVSAILISLERNRMAKGITELSKFDRLDGQ